MSAQNTRIHEKKFQILDNDVKNGRVQRMIDNGWTTIQVARKYEVSESTIKRYSKDGKLSFMENRNRGTKAEEIALSEQMTDAKRLALSGKW